MVLSKINDNKEQTFYQWTHKVSLKTFLLTDKALPKSFFSFVHYSLSLYTIYLDKAFPKSFFLSYIFTTFITVHNLLLVVLSHIHIIWWSCSIFTLLASNTKFIADTTFVFNQKPVTILVCHRHPKLFLDEVTSDRIVAQGIVSRLWCDTCMNMQIP